MNQTEDKTQRFEVERNRLFAIAYRMLGSVMEAEDAVQETYLRYLAAETESVNSHAAYLTTIVTRYCLDQLKSARVQREQYIGPWLPEPLLTDGAPEQIVSDKESISMAFLVLLESLSPVERAVYLLREIFEVGYAEISKIVEKSEANCRQIHSRARKYIRAHRPRFEPSQEVQQRLIGAFLHAIVEGDVDTLTDLLAAEVKIWSDGGGKVSAATRPIVGRKNAIAFMLGLYRMRPEDATLEIVEANGAISWWFTSRLDTDTLIHFRIGDGKIVELDIIRNPDKLRHLPRR